MTGDDSTFLDRVVRLGQAAAGLTVPLPYRILLAGAAMLWLTSEVGQRPASRWPQARPTLHPMYRLRLMTAVAVTLSELLHVLMLLDAAFIGVVAACTLADPTLITNKAVLVGIMCWGLAIITHARLVASAIRAPHVIRQRLDSAGIPNRVGQDSLGTLGVITALTMVPFWWHAGVRVTKNLWYGEPTISAQHDDSEMVDVYVTPTMDDAKKTSPLKPIFIFVHGGSFLYFDKGFIQAGALCSYLASRGWICMSINYHAAPKYRLPKIVADVKRAIVWAKHEGANHFGGDPSKVAIGGLSAGGYLALMAALTANDPLLQPGFETKDTSVAACVDLSGIHDLADSLGNFGRLDQGDFARFVLTHLIPQRGQATEADAILAFSPFHRLDDHDVHKRLPPIMGIHGTLDSIVPVEDAQSFYTKLAEHCKTCVYIELPNAQHAYNLVPSVRSFATHEAILSFLEHTLCSIPKK